MNITKLAEKYISEYPSIKDCLKKRLINYSSLARKILKEPGLKHTDFDAVLIACRRYAGKLKMPESQEDKIKEIVRKSKVEIINKVAAVVIEKDIYFDDLLKLEKEIKKKHEVFHVIEGSSTITLVTAEDFLEDIEKLFRNKIIRKNRNLAEVMIKSPRQIEETSGVISYLYSLFAERGVNVVEQMSCWTDTLFVIESKDLARIIDTIQFQ